MTRPQIVTNGSRYRIRENGEFIQVFGMGGPSGVIWETRFVFLAKAELRRILKHRATSKPETWEPISCGGVG